VTSSPRSTSGFTTISSSVPCCLIKFRAIFPASEKINKSHRVIFPASEKINQCHRVIFPASEKINLSHKVIFPASEQK
jgi:hypothetical protein